MQHETSKKNRKTSDWIAFELLESREGGDSNGTSRGANGQVLGPQAPCQGSKCAEFEGGTMQSGKHMGVWGEVGDGTGKRVMECEMCTEHDKEGRGWEIQWQ
jgi:hypothetical protein